MIKEISNTPALFINTFIPEKKLSNCYLFNCLKSVFSYIGKLFSSIFHRKNPENSLQIDSNNSSSESSKSGKPIKKKYIDCKIPSDLLNPAWKKIIPESRGMPGSGSLSHLREVYLSQQQKCVVKISSEVDRKRKGSNNSWPHAEEIAYKINKLFAWKVIPKTKIIHGSQLTNNTKSKYVNIQNSMTLESLPNLDRLTFTFQSFIKGKTLPLHNTGYQKIQDKSYQRAYLLNMILGKRDARADNTMYDSTNKEIFEVDNESLGLKNYSLKGVLRKFKKLQKKPIDLTILNDISKADIQSFTRIKEKYETKDLSLLNLWLAENSDSTKASENEINLYWETIRTNFITLQSTIKTLQTTQKSFTIKQLEKAYTQARAN
ncbi:MAG: hypothetical protein V4494_02120 [Chlamydiota bacterium]